MNYRTLPLLLIVLMGFVSLAHSRGNDAKELGIDNVLPKELEGIGIEQKLKSHVDMNMKFVDDSGKTVTLQDLANKGKPLLLSLAYYNCPSLCSFHLNGVVMAFRGLAKPIGDDFQFVVVSIDPREGPALAKAKKENYIKYFGKPDTGESWHFLTGDEKNVTALAGQVGFKYRWDEKEKQYAHASAAVFISTTGQIIRYLPGIEFKPNDIRMAALEASKDQASSVIDRLILFCYHYNPVTNQYSLYIWNVMRGAAVLTILILGIFLGSFWLRQRPVQS